MATTPLFHEVMGAAFDSLPPELRSPHDVRPVKRMRGRGTIVRGTHPLATLIAALTSLPPSRADAPVEVEITTIGSKEIWHRDFDGHPMRSQLWAAGGLLCERLGPVKLEFKLIAQLGKIQWQVTRASFLFIPMPIQWFRDTGAIESVVEGKYTFSVYASLPIIGPLIRYEGWLKEYE